MLHTKIWSYALDSKHGFGILSNFSANTDSAPCFFEDGTLENVRPSDVYMDNSVNNLLAEGSGRGHYYNAKETRLADTIAAKAVCTFSRGKENSLQAVLSHGSEKVTITVSLQRYSYATSCSCATASATPTTSPPSPNMPARTCWPTSLMMPAACR